MFPPNSLRNDVARPATRVASSRHLRVLLQKNVVLKRREWSATCCPWCPLAACCELVLPLAVLGLLWWAREQCAKGGQCKIPVLEGWGGQMPKNNYTTVCSEGIPLTNERGQVTGFSTCHAWTDYAKRPLPFMSVLAYLHFSGKRLALAVERDTDLPKVENMRKWISENWHPDLVMTDIPCRSLEQDWVSKFTPAMNASQDNATLEPHSTLACNEHIPNPGKLPNFASLTVPRIYTNTQLNSYLDSHDYGREGLLWGAVVFSKVPGDGRPGAPGDWSYRIRLNVSSQSVSYTGVPSTRPLDLGIRMGEASTYQDFGFTSVQLLLDRYIIGNRSDVGSASDLLVANGLWVSDAESKDVRDQLAEPLRYAPQALQTAPLPVAGVIIDGFYELVSLVFPLVFIVAFLYTQKKVLNELITEKESKVRESLRMMGVTSLSIIGSWYATYALIFGVLCLVFALVASLHVFPNSATSLLFAFFWLWSMSFLAFAFFIHSFFNHSRTGGVVGMMIMFTQWILYASENKSGPASPAAMVALMLMPNGAFCAGLSVLSKYEAAKIGATWDNLAWPINNTSFAWVLRMMCFDIVLWTVLGWYFDRVLPKEYGVRLPLTFPFRASFWCDRPDRDAEAILGSAQDGPSAVCAARDAVEPVAEAVRARSLASGTILRTEGLRKEFSTPGGLKVAVAGLDLTMYEGQILALLGHNGAGKSTTIHMLTGMVTPTAGDASVAGHSLRTGMGEIRRIIGVCPQHDVLWLELTVLEHLTVYARLRGVPEADVPNRAHEMMLQVGLTEKAQTRAGSLSGGQKRKLSLCLALIGRPRVCFLDEPTSGMDPFSRRFTWNIVRGVREDRVIVLTTHFMDEADILGDRIAIMAAGVLQCCGSSLFLKNRFGAGYRITCARKIIGPATSVGAIADEAGGQANRREDVSAVILRHLPEAELLTNVGAELSMRLPMSTGQFVGLFEELDTRLPELGVEHYGLSMVTMEEVFLRVASGEISSLDNVRNGAVAAGDSVDTISGAQCGGSARTGLLVGQVLWEDSLGTEHADVADRGRSHEIHVMARHLGSLFMKRARYGRRDFKSLACMVLLPVILLAFGLWLLQRAGERHLPSILLSISAQYGDDTEVPYNATHNGWADSALTAGSVLGGRTVAESVPSGLDSGEWFGRNYSAGLPTVKLCEEKSTFLSKCWRERYICKAKVPSLFPGRMMFEDFWTAYVFVRDIGIGINCKTNQTTCKGAILDACKDDASQCVNLCTQRSGRQVARSVCQQQCDVLCQEAANVTALCDVLVAGTSIAWYCPEGCADPDDASTCFPGTVCDQPRLPNIGNPDDTLNFAMLLWKESQGRTRKNTRYGAILASETASLATAVTLLYNTSGVNAVPTFINLVSGAFKRAVSGDGSSISVVNDPMPRAATEVLDRVVSTLVNLISTFVIIIAFSWVPAAIVAYIVREREAHHNSKHQQLISGVSLIAYWVANLLWDTCLYLVPLTLSMLFMHALNVEVFIANGALWASSITFLGYGLAIAPFSYLLSFFFSKHTTAQVLCLVINFVTGLLLMVASYILSAIEDTRDVNESLMWVYRLFPGFCLGHGLFQICTNSLLASQLHMGSGIHLLDWDVAGKDVFYLYTAAPVYFTLVVLVDYLMHSPLAAASKHLDPHVTEGEEVELDEDVAAEVARVASGAADRDVVKLSNLRKVYRTPEGLPKVAVHGLSFGLRKGECFGFLGINGAGKTSTLNMLTGAVLPSGGTAYVGGHDIVMEQWKVRRLLGYCPQHDALLDRLTVREHLELFGRIKSIKRRVLRGFCDAMMRDLSLEEHVDKMAMTLSGGNKRKLSLAIALMGSPPLVLLDEPSTGVDPAARRLMWNVITSASTVRRQCSVMLTTHNMEEAEALCSRIGIMVGGRLRCIGSNQRLKARFGSGYQLEARLESPNGADATEMLQRSGLHDIVTPDMLTILCGRLGAPHRAASVREGCEEGYVIHEAFSREGSVSARLFIEWWLLEDRVEALGHFLQREFSGTVALERHDRTLRYCLPAASRLAQLFKCLEEAKQALHLEEYGICQTSLEQIFNDFAAQQTEETAAVRGLFGSGQPGP